jgi:acetate kinase
VRRVLILNAGSSSLKWSILDVDRSTVIDSGNSAWHGDGTERHAAEARELLRRLPAVDAVGHRVVHGGARFEAAVIVDAAVHAAIEDLTELAPLHNPAALAGIDAVTATYPALPQVAAFDTAFHATIPEASARYAVPWQWTEQWQLRRYGFHGLSVSYAARRCAALLGATPRRLVVCHLGAGCSITAVLDGRSVDTSMGFTPLDGVMMATRSGALDPGLLLYAQRKLGAAAPDLEDALNERSGLSGVSGVSGDLRAVLKAMKAGDARAKLAYDMFIHGIVRMVGSMIAVLGGMDTIVFTGGVGEHSASVRQAVTSSLDFAGVALDAAANEAVDSDMDIALTKSVVRVLVVTAREDLAILEEMKRLLG